ncbi:hypothetical protein BG015_010270 [Linnemannia schmuckeri]|uniref:Uncharacterized protein n=1 Tax=Linnemannia schmuckeri TaxID=64567 RepID=A0A9P5V9C4_9FUNG|nr:hypothetical protein BG015_010270 [Linnemannia schmuckeri]
MRFSTITVFPVMALVLSTMTILPFTTSAAGTFVPRAAPTPCDQCLEDAMILLQPACASLSNIGTIKEFSDSKLTPQHRKCYCSLPAGNAWYQSCQTTNKCNAEMMGLAAQFVEILRTKTVCVAEAGSGSGSGSGSVSGSNGAGGNATVNVLASDAPSRKAIASSVGVVVAAAAVFATFL